MNTDTVDRIEAIRRNGAHNTVAEVLDTARTEVAAWRARGLKRDAYFHGMAIGRLVQLAGVAEKDRLESAIKEVHRLWNSLDREAA